MDPVFLTGLIIGLLRVLSSCGLTALILLVYAAIAGTVELTIYNIGITGLAAWLMVSRVVEHLVVMDDFYEGDDSDEQE